MVQAVNDVLDAHTRRLTAAMDHMPDVVSVLLLLIAALFSPWRRIMPVFPGE
jgi:hypothetical protein